MNIVLHPTPTAQWHSLVCEAEAEADFYMDEELQSYLVFLLMRHLSKPELASRILALDYLKGMLAAGNHQHNILRDVGDACLLYAGFFPKQANRRRVSHHYFSDLGCGAYQQLSDTINFGLGSIYSRLSETFISISDVLQAMRQLGNETIASEVDTVLAQYPIPAVGSGYLSPKKHLN